MKVENMLPMQSIQTEKQQTKTSSSFNHALIDEQSIQSNVSNEQQPPYAAKPHITANYTIISEESVPYLSVKEIQFFDQLFQKNTITEKKI